MAIWEAIFQMAGVILLFISLYFLPIVLIGLGVLMPIIVVAKLLKWLKD